MTPAKTRLARAEVAKAFQKAAPGRVLYEGPLRLHVQVVHASNELWEGRFCRLKPDLDNILKLIGDALNGIAYLDDAQIIEMAITKAYGPESVVRIRLEYEEEIPKPVNGKKRIYPGFYGFFAEGEYRGGAYSFSRKWLLVPGQAVPSRSELESFAQRMVLAATAGDLVPTLDHAQERLLGVQL